VRGQKGQPGQPLLHFLLWALCVPTLFSSIHGICCVISYASVAVCPCDHKPSWPTRCCGCISCGRECSFALALSKHTLIKKKKEVG
jgi:hypothetical protein